MLEKDINKNIGLKLDMLSLSPVLKIGITVEYFNLDFGMSVQPLWIEKSHRGLLTAMRYFYHSSFKD
jgi:hypothetical protein